METLSDWNEARVTQLTALHDQGLSFTLISRSVGKTRNACIGKAHRLSLPPRATVMVCERAQSESIMRVKSKKIAAVEIENSVHKPCSILELNEYTCRYPLWSFDRKAARWYCGHPTACLSEGRPYCAHHAQICSTVR